MSYWDSSSHHVSHRHCSHHRNADFSAAETAATENNTGASASCSSSASDSGGSVLSSFPAGETSSSGLSDILTQFRTAVQSTVASFKSFLQEMKPQTSQKPFPEKHHHDCHAPCSTSQTASTASTGAAVATSSSEPRTVLTFSERQKQTLTADADGKVTEAELRRGVVSYALYFKDASLGASFDKSYKEAVAAGKSSSAALEKGLIDLIDSGKFPREDANWVYSLSRRAADFSNVNPGKIDTTGGIDRDAAISFAEASLAGIQSGAVHVDRIKL